MSMMNARLWSMPTHELVEWMESQHPDKSEFRNGLAVLQAKALVADEATARATRLLAWATFALVVVTAVLVVVSAFT
jgi:hypothetical protein